MQIRGGFYIAPALFAVVFLLLSFADLQALDREVVISAYQGPCADGDFAANLETVRKQTREAVSYTHLTLPTSDLV